jgi:hypothetical protein
VADDHDRARKLLRRDTLVDDAIDGGEIWNCGCMRVSGKEQAK